MLASSSLRGVLEFAVLPGRSLGEIALGEAMNSVLKYVQEKNAVAGVEFKYNDEEPLSTDMVIRLPKNGLVFRFEPASQRLKSIEIFQFNHIRLSYQGHDFSSAKIIPTFLLMYKLFGPTYPGTFDATLKEYTLKYPGVSMVFPIPDQHVPLYTKEDMPLEFPDGTTPVLSRLYLYHGADNWRQAVPPPLPVGHAGGSGLPAEKLSNFTLTPHRGVTLHFANGDAVHVRIGTTDTQDLLTELGEPDAVWRKREDKLRIHAPGNADHASAESDTDDNPVDYFFNYFRYGFDVLLDGRTHRCLKLVLHTNFPGHYDFDRYRKCQFSIQTDEDSAKGSITADSKWSDIERVFGPAQGRQVILNRGSHHADPFGATAMRGYDGLIFEIMKNGHLATLTIY
ncbi:hypothetical protein THASP1DRAFT_28418 [Thamnocephalis sphaerospora]|uniref:Uncharacterized protein n=1 Tax=Thamnocephalis sphaerospora TaxID=78915 RepID=A0A4V1IX47_9FUNG|nr:hypothetical protein THASP1DRAFT_28418 [Thamnocephalis sphaerospora]|eukprot:RKP09799.1 hypothetical protein THASP1DRAFT_28418 [Thamnocephalis sphaerospora]